MRQFEATSTSYAIPVTIEEFQSIEEKDNQAEACEHCLFKWLESIEGVSNIDYNGHFGPFIYLQIETPLDNDETKAFISQLLQDFIDGKICDFCGAYCNNNCDEAKANGFPQ